jgi:hypothetical protein
MTTRRQHFVSRCYLKHFSVLRKPKYYTTNVFDRKDGRTYAPDIMNVAHERDFNTVNVEGLAPDAFETGTALFEDELAPALQRIIDNRSLQNTQDAGLLLNFMALLAIRNPRLRENVRAFHEEMLMKLMRAQLATPERWAKRMERLRAQGKEETLTYEQMKSVVFRDDYKINISTERHIVLEARVFKKVLRTMFDRKWVLLKAPATSGGFITCDHPVCLLQSGRGRMFAGGYGSPSTQVVFPISPGLAIIGAFELTDGEADNVDEGTIAQVNGAIAMNAERQVYSLDDRFKYKFSDAAKLREASELVSDREWLRPA